MSPKTRQRVGSRDKGYRRFGVVLHFQALLWEPLLFEEHLKRRLVITAGFWKDLVREGDFRGVLPGLWETLCSRWESQRDLKPVFLVQSSRLVKCHTGSICKPQHSISPHETLALDRSQDDKERFIGWRQFWRTWRKIRNCTYSCQRALRTISVLQGPLNSGDLSDLNWILITLPPEQDSDLPGGWWFSIMRQ